MSKTSITLVAYFYLIVLCAQGQCIEQCFNATSGGNKICLDKCGSDYLFKSCSKFTNNCAQNSSINTSCIIQTPITQKQCQDTCCDNRFQDINVGQFQSCNKNQQKNHIMIMALVVCSLLFLLLIIVCIISKVNYCRESVAQCCCKQLLTKKVVASNYQQQAQVEGNSDFIRKDSISKDSVSLQKIKLDEIKTENLDGSISKEQLKNTSLISTPCAICLQTNLNARTSCGHLFHLKCLLEWSARKNNCPLCKGKRVLSHINVCCNECKDNFIPFNSIDDINKQNYLKLQRYTCENCSNKERKDFHSEIIE